MSQPVEQKMQSVAGRPGRRATQLAGTLALSIERICDTFTTLAFERLASPFFRRTLAGAFALLRFEVIRHATLV